MADDIDKQLKLQEQITAIEETAKRFMTRDAITRYGTLKQAHPELAVNVIAMIADAVQSGQINDKIDDNTFKELLKKINESKKETRIRRV